MVTNLLFMKKRWKINCFLFPGLGVLRHLQQRYWWGGHPLLEANIRWTHAVRGPYVLLAERHSVGRSPLHQHPRPSAQAKEGRRLLPEPNAQNRLVMPLRVRVYAYSVCCTYFMHVILCVWVNDFLKTNHDCRLPTILYLRIFCGCGILYKCNYFIRTKRLVFQYVLQIWDFVYVSGVTS